MKSYIWTLPTRLFHWLLAIGFAAAYLLADFDDLRNYHFAFGALVGTLILFRLLFGLFGPKYSHFRDFPIGIGSQFEFVQTFFGKIKAYPGHNPAAAVVMLFIFIVGICCSVSGYYLYAIENNILNLNIEKDIIKETHEIAANLFLVLVGVHLLGVVVDLIFHSKTRTMLSIFTGYKQIDAENAKLNGFQQLFSVLWLTVPFFVFYLAFMLPVKQQTNDNPKSEKTEQHEEEEDDD
jgi:cytochrome b